MQITTPSTRLRYQRHQKEALSLLDAYFSGDQTVIELFSKLLPDGERPDFQPTIQDARYIASKQSLKLNRLNLQKLRKDAKDLLKRLRNNDPESLARLQAYHPKSGALNAGEYKLSDAQLILAREFGLLSWSKLKKHIESIDKIAKELSAGDITMDGDLTTLHIRCGSDLQKVLPKSGFKGDFLEVSNPFPQGPVPPSEPMEHFLDVREKFIERNYGRYLTKDIHGEKPSFRHEEQSLRNLPGRYQRLVLWFEHDAFDQLCFAYILSHLVDADLSRVSVELIQVDYFPGIDRFIGLGQLGHQPESLSLLWDQRRQLTAADFSFGSRIWQAFTSPNPTELCRLSQAENTQLPLMQKAMNRMLKELPWSTNGLGLTEYLMLYIVQQDGPIDRQRLFHFLLAEADPQPFLGDIMFYSALDCLLLTKTPALTVALSNEGKETIQ